MSTVADYVGRQVDLVAFRGMFPSAKEQLLVQEFVRPGDGGQIVAGIQKLAQRFLITLLTPVGSKRYRPADGTLFMIEAQQGFWRTVADVTQSFYAARIDVRRQLNAEETDADPLDERFSSAELVNVTLAGDRISLRILLTSQAGSTFTFLTPIGVTIK